MKQQSKKVLIPIIVACVVVVIAAIVLPIALIFGKNDYLYGQYEKGKVALNEYRAFGDCYVLESVNRPKSLKYLDEHWSKGPYCNDFTKITYNSTVEIPEVRHLFDFEIDDV